MGNKIITEKDFWTCTEGLMPAPFQGTRKGLKKKSGELYITVEDKSTSSCVDFSCKKYMLLMAIAAAVLVVGAILVGVLTVATGGAALIAIGALAGLAGAAIGAVVGGMLCGQKMGSKRIWNNSKSDFILQGSRTITGDHTMTCPIGGVITFAPNIKNWSQAYSLGAANLIGGLMEGMMAGAAVGMGGAAISGGMAAMGGGAGIRGLGQAALQFAKSMPKNFVVNAVESFSKFGLALRGVMGAQNMAATYGTTGQAGAGDFLKGTVAMETGAFESAHNIFTGNGKWQDYVGMAMMFAPVGQGKRDLENSLKNEPEPSKSDSPENESTKNEDENVRTESQTEVEAEPISEGEAHEAGLSRTELVNGDPPFRRNPEHDAAEFQRQIESQEAGMNNLTVGEFINNRDAYLENGRSSEGSAAQQRYREQARADKVREYREQGYTREEANRMADEYMSDKAALHDPDQVAGGHGDNITGLGDKRVNSSLGSQWKTRIEEIDAQIREQAANMTPEQRANTYLNIRLPWE